MEYTGSVCWFTFELCDQLTVFFNCVSRAGCAMVYWPLLIKCFFLGGYIFICIFRFFLVFLIISKLHTGSASGSSSSCSDVASTLNRLPGVSGISCVRLLLYRFYLPNALVSVCVCVPACVCARTRVSVSVFQNICHFITNSILMVEQCCVYCHTGMVLSHEGVSFYE